MLYLIAEKRQEIRVRDPEALCCDGWAEHSGKSATTGHKILKRTLQCPSSPASAHTVYLQLKFDNPYPLRSSQIRFALKWPAIG
jgi:hypothetical protein